MKNTRVLFCMLVGLLIFSPVFADALTEEEAIAQQVEKYSKVSTDNSDGTCTWNFKTIDEEKLLENSCKLSKQQFLEAREWCGENKCVDVSDDELQVFMSEYETTCKTNLFSALLNKSGSKVGLDTWFFNIDWNNLNDVYKDGKFTVESMYDYENTDGTRGYDKYIRSCYINVVDGNKTANKQIKDVVRDMKGSYQLYSLNTFNSVYHYGTIDNDLFNSMLVTYRHPLFKKVLLDNPEFDYDVSWNGAGGTPDITGCDGNVMISQNDVVYAVKQVGFGLNHVLYVDEDLEGTLFEKAENRLKEYFKNKATVDVVEIDIDQEQFNEYGGVLTYVKINEYENLILIKEVAKEDLDNYEVEAYHKSTGVRINSDSYEVPSDATLDVEDVTDDVSKKFDKSMYKVHSAYDIEVVKMANGGFVKTIENGIDVYLPISGRTIGEKMSVYHITDNGKGDGYEGIVVEVEGKQYVKFTTTHFSTYAVIEDTLEVPNTFDGIGYSIITLLVSIITLSGCILYKKKFN